MIKNLKYMRAVFGSASVNFSLLLNKKIHATIQNAIDNQLLENKLNQIGCTYSDCTFLLFFLHSSVMHDCHSSFSLSLSLCLAISGMHESYVHGA